MTHRSLLLIALLFAFGPHAAADSHIKGIKLAVENPTTHAWPAANVVVHVTDLKKVAPDFTPGSFVVTTSDAATLEQDAATLQTTELPSQADDLNNDNKAEEVVFQIDLKPRQTRIV